MVAYDVIVIGAGVVGTACARELARAGARVGVVESGPIGGGATAAGMGHVVVMDDSEAQFALTRYSQQLWHEIASELPPDVEYERCGTIWVAADEEELVEALRKETFYTTRGVPARIVDATELRELEPELRPGLAGGLLVPEDAVVYPPCAAHALLEQSRAHGATLHQGHAVVAITSSGVTLDDGSMLAADRVVNAAGAWAPRLTPSIEVRERKGHLVITDRYPGMVRHQLVELGYLKSAHSVSSDSVAFNVQPRKTGQLLIGSSRQFGAEDAKVEHRILGRMLRRACDYMPALGEFSAIRTWTGFRAATPDKLPLIGRAGPESESLYLATGHEGLGITTSLATARLLTDLLLGRPSAIPVDPYLPTRPMHGALHVA